MGFFKTDCEGFHRRDFLKVGSAGVLGLSLPQVLQLEATSKAATNNDNANANNNPRRRATSVIMVWLAGGPATIDMWDLRPDAPENIRGQFRPINTSANGIQICEHLPNMARVMDKCTIVRSLAHTIPSHSPATVFMNTGNRPTPALNYPSMGSLVTRMIPAGQGVPPYVTFNPLRNGAGGGGYLGTAYNPFTVEGGRNAQGVRGITLPTGFTLEQLENRNNLLQSFDRNFAALDRNSDLADGMDAFHRQALDILRSDATRNAFDLNRESNEVRDRYGRDSLGQAALSARRLVQAGVRFVTLSTGGWDTHNQNFQRLSSRNLPPLDRTLAALIQDLDDQGLLDSTIVYCAGEFGRTPRINRRGGRDHWARSMSVVLAGGGIRRGYAHGTTDTNGMAPNLNPCTPDDIAATICHNLGIDPQHELMTPTGRPIQLFREGSVINDMMS